MSITSAVPIIGEKGPEMTIKKIKLLWLSDTPTCSTGFAQVARNLLKVLHDTGKYEITVLGINQSDYYDRAVYPYIIHEAMPALTVDPKYRDLFGRQRLLDLLGTGKYDLLFTMQDTFIIEAIAQQIVETRKVLMDVNKNLNKPAYTPFKWIFYFPVDSSVKQNWVENAALLADYPVVYTKYGYTECAKATKPNSVFMINGTPHESTPDAKRIDVIYHGVNTKEFYPIEDSEEIKKFKTQYFQGKADNKFLIVNVNRNQPRKDLPRTLAAFSRFLERRPDSFLYLHCQVNDVGGNLVEYARNFPNLHLGENWSTPSPKSFDAHDGVPIETLNKIYNAADVLVSTTWGEGWGLSFTEAMAAKTLVIAPRNTSLPEIVGEHDERGILYKSGEGSAFVCADNDNERLRPLADVDDLAEKLEWAYANRGTAEYTGKIEAAYAWVKSLTWEGDKIGRRWVELFDRAVKDLQIETSTFAQMPGRNEPCPCGSGDKFKRCHGRNIR